MTRQASDAQWLDNPALRRAIFVGTGTQAATVLIGHYRSWILSHDIGFLFAGMMISATMGYLYALDVAKGYGRGAYGGAIAGGVCAAIGISISVLLRDMSPQMFALRTMVSVLTGAVGGIFGQLAADWD